MSAIRGKNTKPELIIRKCLHHQGFRYRLHRKDLPGKPDLVFPKHNAVIYVNGCFFHGHDCHLFKVPATRREFWQEKISDNRNRDKNNWDKIKSMGWRVIVVWECALKGKTRTTISEVSILLREFLEGEEKFVHLTGKNSKAENGKNL